ncbi:transmembrane protein 254 [Varanus komodoensis]|uniref:Transmembrane protein 254 n=1 Tax=Varanus komodoensis TaxID=61221 RepID=A0A8D2JFP7_VARKO|nr:transmembrane protein 254 [Varanus komodoensis]
MAAGSAVQGGSGRPRQSKDAGNPCTYFRRADLLWMAVIGVGLLYYSWVVFAPSTVPYGLLGPFGSATKYLLKHHKIWLQVGYVVTWLIHIGEALYSLKLCKAKGITDKATQLRWFVQTFFFGMASFHLLLFYKPQRKHE